MKNALLYFFHILRRAILSLLISNPSFPSTSSYPSSLCASRLGININFRNSEAVGLTGNDILKHLLAFPAEHVRISIPFDYVANKENVYDFSIPDRIIKAAIAKHKKIHLVVGSKTTAGSEVNVPSWYKKTFPHTQKRGYCIGTDANECIPILSYAEATARHYLTSKIFAKHIASVHLENEGDDMRVSVANFRSVSHDLIRQEHAIIRKCNKTIPLVRNAPLDTPENMRMAIQHCDVVGVNVYPQAWHPFPRPFEWFVKRFFWQRVYDAFSLARKYHKKVYIVENQTTYWYEADGTPKFPFSPEQFTADLKRLQSLTPAIIFLWDLESLIKNKEQHLFLETLFGDGPQIS